MNNNWIFQVLKGHLNTQQLDKLNINYEEFKDYKLTDLGIDSLSVMGIFLNIEESYNKRIDYESFDIDSISTLSKIKEFIGEV